MGLRDLAMSSTPLLIFGLGGDDTEVAQMWKYLTQQILGQSGVVQKNKK